MKPEELPKVDRPAPPEVDAAGYAFADYLAIKAAREDHDALVNNEKPPEGVECNLKTDLNP